jgi:TRAP-type C4-dicarboxylate transport system substrate-binding protein
MKRSALLCALALTLLAWAAPAAGEAKPIRLIYANYFNADSSHSILCQAWAGEIEKRTQGRVRVVYYPGSQLLTGEQIFLGVVDGVADLGMGVMAYNLGRFPVMGVLDLPWGYESGRQATAVINDYYQKFKPKELNPVKVLYLHAPGPSLLHTVKKVEKLEDLKGLRIRSTGFSALLAKALGATPVALTQNAVYLALANDLVDGTFNPLEALLTWHQAQVLHYTLSCANFGYTSGMYLAMNLKRWNSLPKDVQEIIESVSAGMPAKHAEAWDQGDKQGRQYTLSLGNEIFCLDEQEARRWEAAMAPVTERYLEKLRAKEMPADEYANEVRALLKKYR